MFQIITMYPLIYVIVCVFGYVSQGRSLYDMESQNMTDFLVDIPTGKDSDIFRQLLNQETIIRMSMVKNLHLLMQDVVTLKEDMVSMKDRVDSLEKQSERLTTENKFLIEENTYLDKQLESVNTTFLQMKNELNKSERIAEEKMETFERNISGILGDIKIEVRYLSVTLLNLNDHTRELDKSIPETLEENNRSVFDFINRTYDQLINDKTEINGTQMEMMSSLSDLKAVQNNLTKHIIDDMNTKMSDIQENIQQWEQDKTKLTLSVTSLKLSLVKEKVAFTVGITSGKSGWSGSTLVFDKIIYEIGGGYSTSTGIFTSPTDGTFVFYVVVVSEHTKYIYFDIVLDNVSKVRTMSFGNTVSNVFQTGTNMVVLNIHKGDRVWIKKHQGTGYYSRNIPIITFSGFRIY